ncbi:MAG: flagellar filament capping protein FliD [Sulfurospirillum sp.]
MANSTISSLGIGSQGVLSYDVIDKLKKVDENATIKPIDNQITQNKTELNDLSILTTMTASLKSATSTLSDESSYLKRTVTSSNSGVSVSAKDGTEPQNFSFDVTTLAKRDINESQAFNKTTDTFATADDTIHLAIDGNTYNIKVTSSTTISEFQSKIYDATSGKITASLLNVGGVDPYKLVLKSTNTGANNAITVTTDNNSDSISTNDTNLAITNIQPAGDLNAKFNGVQITRSTNTIDDLVVGATITATQVVNSNVSIKQDSSTISSALQSFVNKYNDLMNNLNESTKYDVSTKAAGTFQGSSQIKSLKNDIRNELFAIDSKGRSLEDYGITLNSAGLLQFDSSVFDSKMQNNSSDVENYFRGDTNTNGFFTNYNNMLSGYIDSRTGLLTQFNTQLTDEKTSLSEKKITATEKLNSKYDILTKKFIAYDAIINKLNASFQSLSMQISQATTSTKY